MFELKEPTLFDQVMTVNRKTSSNSIEAFHTKDIQLKRITQKQKILMACEKLRLANDRMLSVESGVPLNLTPDRRGQLVIDKKLRFVFNKIDPVTKKTTDFYEVVR